MYVSDPFKISNVHRLSRDSKSTELELFVKVLQSIDSLKNTQNVIMECIVLHLLVSDSFFFLSFQHKYISVFNLIA